MNHALTINSIDDDIGALRRYAAGGDPRAFEILATRYQAMVLAICRRVLGNDADAEDATQETFLRLARSASTIKSNAGAWLHSCAMNACRDLMRRKGSEVRAHAGPSVSLDAVPDSGEPETARLWRDIEPLLDAALADLSDEDRDVIVARFLAGRPLNELAAQAGVAAGTMHRRIDRALANLRARLGPGVMGVGALASPEVLSATLEHAATSQIGSAAVTAAIAKIPLTGIGATIATTSAARSVATIVLLATLGVGTVGAGAWYLFPAKTITLATAAAFDPKAKFERPAKETEPIDLFAASASDQPLTHVRFHDDIIDFRMYPEPDGTWRGAIFEILEFVADKPKPGVTAKGWMKIRLKSSSMPDAKERFALIHDQVLDSTYEIRGERIILTQSTPERTDTNWRMSWDGRRWDEGKPITLGETTPAQLAAHKKPAAAEFPREPALAGTWREQPPLEFALSPNNVTVMFKGSNGQFGDRYRIIEWTADEGFAKAQLIVARSYDPTRIGKRFKALIRKDEHGYTTATHLWTSTRMNEWPSGFDAKKDPTLSVLTWKPEETP